MAGESSRAQSSHAGRGRLLLRSWCRWRPAPLDMRDIPVGNIDPTMSQLMSDLAFLICAYLAAVTSMCLVVLAVF